MIEHGRNLYVLLKENGTGVIIAGTRSNEFQTDIDLQEVSSPKTGKWKEYLLQREEWNVTTNYLVTSDASLLSLLETSKYVTLSFVSRSPGGTVTELLTGEAWVKSCKITATLGNLAQGSFQFVGNGPLAPPEEPDPEDEGEDDSEEEEQ